MRSWIEEIRVIGPAIERLANSGLRISGPIPADTAFVPRILADFDRRLTDADRAAMTTDELYDDAGLPR